MTPRHRATADRQRDEHRRGGLLPRQRVRRHRAAHRVGRAWRAASCANTERLLDIFDEFERPQHVLRARLGRRAPSASWCARSPRAATRSRRTATRIGSSTTRRRAAFRDDVRRAKELLEDAVRPAGASAIARRATRSRRGRCGRSTSCIEEGYQLRLEHLPDSPRSLRHSRVRRGIRTAIDRAAGSAGRSARLDDAGRAGEPAGRRRRLLPHPAVRVDALGHRAGQPRWSGGRRSSTCTRGRSIPDQPRLRAGTLGRFRHYRNLDQTEARLRQLLTDFRFDTVEARRRDDARDDPGHDERVALPAARTRSDHGDDRSISSLPSERSQR